jgi:RNA recognition motif-containing protein
VSARPHSSATAERIIHFFVSTRARVSVGAFLKGSIMSNKLYVGNLSYSMRDDDLQQQFAAFGQVQSAKVMMERDTGRSKGFGFVEMSNAQEAQAAIEGMNGKNVGGRDLTVNIARPMEPRAPRSGGGFGGGGGYGGGRRNSY